MENSKEIKDLEKAFVNYISKHGHSNVIITASVIAFNKDGEVVDDQIWLVGDDEMILTQLDCIKTEMLLNKLDIK